VRERNGVGGERLNSERMLGIRESMEQCLAERSFLFNAWSEFSCPDSCQRIGCKHPDLHISISLVDLIAFSLVSGQKASDLFTQYLKIGFDPFSEKEPWIGRISMELKKPCQFLDGKKCSIYPGRPTACALFPESCFIVEHPKGLLKKDLFQNFPCIQNPCFVSSRRRRALQEVFEMSIKEAFLSDFYLFVISPFLLDLKSIAGKELEGVNILEEGRAEIPHHRIEEIIFQGFSGGGYWDAWKTKIEPLDRTNGLDVLTRMKSWTDRMAEAVHGIPLRIAYQFDGTKLRPIHFYAPSQKATPARYNAVWRSSPGLPVDEGE
jgi:Fe-S-cluster containining protein